MIGWSDSFGQMGFVLKGPRKGVLPVLLQLFAKGVQRGECDLRPQKRAVAKRKTLAIQRLMGISQQVCLHRRHAARRGGVSALIEDGGITAVFAIHGGNAYIHAFTRPVTAVRIIGDVCGRKAQFAAQLLAWHNQSRQFKRQLCHHHPSRIKTAFFKASHYTA